MNGPVDPFARVVVEYPRSEALGLAALAELLCAEEVAGSTVWVAALEGLARTARALRVETGDGGDHAA